MSENVLGDGIGYVRLLDSMPAIGTGGEGDTAIAAAARISYSGGGTKQVNSDAGLIRYLMRHRHTGPLEMVKFKFHVCCPIFVARQWMRHRTASINEMSARYSVMADRFYVPSADVIGVQDIHNKQGRSAAAAFRLPESTISDFRAALFTNNERAYVAYTLALEQGIPRELARMLLPANLYTEFVWAIDLHNLLHFIRLRADAHAQYEIQQYAKAMLALITPLCPVAVQAFRDFQLDSVVLSAAEVGAVRYVLDRYDPLGTPLPRLLSAHTSAGERREWEQKVAVIFSRPA